MSALEQLAKAILAGRVSVEARDIFAPAGPRAGSGERVAGRRYRIVVDPEPTEEPS